MISTIETILPKLKQKHSDIPEDVIELIVDIYFRTLIKTTRNPTKPEIATLWGTLLLKRNKTKVTINKLIKEFDSMEGVELESAQKFVNTLLELQKIQEHIIQHGKTHRSSKRK